MGIIVSARPSFSEGRSIGMEKSGYRIVGYLLAAALGVIVGGLAVALGSKAIPIMMSRMMGAAMENMRAQMGGEGCGPEDL
jgi:hypothetical protein